MFESGLEQGQMMPVLMRHCETMKRQETRLRLATAVLLATFLATLLWLQFHQQTTKGAFSGAHSEAENFLKTEEPPIRHTVHLEPVNQSDACSEEQPINWNIIDDGNDSQNFKLENQTVLHVFTKGLYLINLRISYRVYNNQCESHSDPEVLTLEVNVSQKHRNYDREREVISGKESMLCRDYWLQSITLNRVIMLEADTSLRVKLNKKSCKFVRNRHLEVTYL
ncbi:hypothetical protein R3I94_003095 [Phoxinus phoxinus]